MRARRGEMPCERRLRIRLLGPSMFVGHVYFGNSAFTVSAMLSRLRSSVTSAGKPMTRQNSPRIEEVTARCGRIRKQMQVQGLDGLFVMQPMNVWYVAGFWEYVPIRIQAVLIPAEGDCVFIVSKNEYEYAVKSSWISDTRYYTEFPEQGRHQNPYDLIVEAVHDRGLERAVLGIEEDFMPIGDYGRLRELLPKVRFKDAS